MNVSYMSLGVHLMSSSTDPLAVTRRPIDRPLNVIASETPLVMVTVCKRRCCSSSMTPLSK